MADVSVKMGVSGLAQFKQSMTDASASVKTLDAALKANEKAMKQNGQTESYMATQANLLNAKLKEQGNVARAAEQALKQMEANGVQKTSASYQNMQRRMIEARSSMMDTEEQIRTLGTASLESSGQTDKLADSLGGLNKRISLEQVSSAVKSITGGLENAAKKAVDLGEKLFNVIMDSAAQADDISTMATRLGMTDEQVQQMMYVADRFEAPVEAMAKTWKKLKNNMASDSAEIVEDFKKIGVATHEVTPGKYGEVIGPARDYLDVFWEVGDALMAMTDASEQERIAQKLLGRSWDEMIPLFTKGREAYEAALEAAPTASEEAVESAASLNDRVKELEKSWDTLKLQALETIAPALEKGADAIANILDKVTGFLQTEKGQELLDKLGESVSNLFGDLANISAEDVESNVTSVLTALTGGLKWLADNWSGVKDALEKIVEGWALLKVTGGAADVLKLVQGVMGLAGGGSAAAAAGASAGASWGGAFASAVLKAAPWLVFLSTLLHISDTGNNDLADANGNLTEEGWLDFRDQRARAARGETQDNVWYDLIMEAGEIVQEAAKLWDDTAGIQALARYATSGNKEQLAADLQALGYVLQEAGKMEALDAPRVYVENDKGQVIHKDRRTGKTIPQIDPNKPELEIYDIPIEALLQAPEDAAEDLEKQVGAVTLPVQLMFSGFGGRNPFESGNPLLNFLGFGSHANGLWSVPFDGYMAMLHKDEQIVSAREVSSRNFSSNLYVEAMYMNNGTDVQGLSAAMAAENQRIMSGHGS